MGSSSLCKPTKSSITLQGMSTLKISDGVVKDEVLVLGLA